MVILQGHRNFQKSVIQTLGNRMGTFLTYANKSFFDIPSLHSELNNYHVVRLAVLPTESEQVTLKMEKRSS